MTQKEQKLLTYLQETFDEAKRLTEGSRKEGRDAYEYMRGNQLPDEVKAELESREQPARWENIYMKIDNKVEGMKMMTREEIAVLPRSIDKKEQFITITNVLRASQDATEWKTHKKRADRDLRVVGLSVVEEKLHVLDETDARGKKLKEVKRIHLPALECLPDMYATAPDMRDSRYFHHTRMMYKPALKKLFGSKADTLAANDAEMVRVNRTWYRNDKGEARVAVWSDNVLLEDKPTPFNKLDRFPLAIRRLRWSHKKEYYGMYRDVRPFQDSVNFTMLRLINMLGSSKLLVESDAVDDIDTFTDEYNLDNSVTQVKSNALKEKKIQDISQSTNISQLMNVIQDARMQAEMVIGLNSEVLGSAVNRLSGYAIESRQNAGLVGLQNYMDVSGELDIDLAQIDLKIMEEHFTAEQIFYIDGKGGEDREAVVLNPYERDDAGRMNFDAAGAPMQKNIMSLGRYDVSFKRVPFNRGATGERQKNWAEVMKVLSPEVAQALVPSMLRDVESPEAEEAQRVIDEMKAQSQQDDQGMQAQMEQMQLQMEGLASKIRERDSKANLNDAKAKEITEGSSQKT